MSEIHGDDEAPIDVRSTLSLALLLGLGTAIAAISVLGVAGAILAAAAPAGKDGAKIPHLPAGLVALVVAQGIVSLVGAIGALRGQSWGRVVVAATGALGIAGSLMRGITDPASVMVLPLHVACLFLLAPSVGRWTTDEGRAAAKRFATRAYASIVLWVLLIFGWLLVETPLKEIFDNMSIELPWMAQVTLNAGAFLKDFGVLLPLAPPLIVLGFFPVLWVPTSHRRSVTIGINFIGPLVLAITVISIVLPIVKLRDSLGQ